MDANEAGIEALIKNDPDMARAFKLAGKPPSRKRAPGFSSLLRTIVNQQVSVHAAQAIWERLENSLGSVDHKKIENASDETLRSFGLSAAKVRYARELAGAATNGSLDLKGLEKLDDETARAELTKIKGIGLWTADIYLMFSLGRPDIWPIGDLALAEATKRLLGLRKRPDPKKLASIGHKWRPWRTSAAVMLWHYYKN